MSLNAVALESRKLCLATLSKAKSPHAGSAMSTIDILVFLYERYLRNEANPNSIHKMVFSKGHAAVAVYSVMAVLGIISKEELKRFCHDGSHLYGHVSHLAHTSIQLSTGSLGHGLPFAVGIAHAKKLKGETGRVFVVMSDGELNEGTTWESALLGSKFNLKNLTVIVDRNRMQSLESTEATLPLDPLESKWESFGWRAIIADGHDFESLAQMENPQDGPTVLIANTTKGKGISWMENDIKWHYKWPSDSELQEALIELELKEP